jgi:hypothetical protein
MSKIFMRTSFDCGNKFSIHEDNQDRSGAQEESAVSFLGFDVRELDEDFAILRGLHDFSEAVTPSEGVAGRVPPPTSAAAPPPSSPSKDTSKPQGIRKRRRRKRVRSSCTIEGCPNRVVQGGVCITHGAKRKLCKFAGCDKGVKKAGFCSTHGPARKRCEIPGCSRVAVQGGICIGHGAKKNQCEAEGCRRLSVMAGLCKAHCDEVGQAAVAPATPASATSAQVVGSPAEDPSLLDQYFEIPNLTVATAIAQAPAPSRAFQQTMYARGLSIFEEMGVASGRVVGNPLPPPPPLPQQHGTRHRSTLSRDLQSLYDEDLDLEKFEAI